MRAIFFSRADVLRQPGGHAFMGHFLGIDCSALSVAEQGIRCFWKIKGCQRCESVANLHST